MEPLRVKYDYDNFEITIPVQVLPAQDSQSKPPVFTPPVAIPKCNEQCWILHWELDDDSKKLARFSGYEELDFDVPEPLELELLGLEDVYCRMRATCKNEKPKFASIELFFDPKIPSINNGEIFSHDPTIAVTLDPVDGRSCRVPKADAVLALKD